MTTHVKKSRRKKVKKSAPKTTSTTYEIRVVGTAKLTIDDALIASIGDDWRKQFYALHTPKEIADHVGFNMMVHDLSLSEIDGFADRKDEEAVMVDIEWEMDDD